MLKHDKNHLQSSPKAFQILLVTAEWDTLTFVITVIANAFLNVYYNFLTFNTTSFDLKQRLPMRMGMRRWGLCPSVAAAAAAAAGWPQTSPAKWQQRLQTLAAAAACGRHCRASCDESCVWSRCVPCENWSKHRRIQRTKTIQSIDQGKLV